MNTARLPSRPEPARARAVTLLELLIAVSLTMLIILALYQMFSRTQRLMRGSIVAGDLTENGRACLDMIRRELETMAPAGSPLNPAPFITNVWIDTVTYSTNAVRLGGGAAGGPPLISELHDIFFLGFDSSEQVTPRNWSAIGYRVADPANALLPVTNGVGTLYRFFTNSTRANSNMVFLRDYITPPSMGMTNYFQRVADGVVHLTLRVLSNGLPMAGTNVTFRGTDSPSVVELEIGFLETPVYNEARGLSAVAASNYLASRGAHVHFFRTLIPVRATPQ
jgi:hypothetical protein